MKIELEDVFNANWRNQGRERGNTAVTHASYKKFISSHV